MQRAEGRGSLRSIRPTFHWLASLRRCRGMMRGKAKGILGRGVESKGPAATYAGRLHRTEPSLGVDLASALHCIAGHARAWHWITLPGSIPHSSQQ